MPGKLEPMLQRALSAAFGVQSQKNRVQAFDKGSASWFILAGITLTVVFITALLTVVNLVVA